MIDGLKGKPARLQGRSEATESGNAASLKGLMGGTAELKRKANNSIANDTKAAQRGEARKRLMDLTIFSCRSVKRNMKKLHSAMFWRVPGSDSGHCHPTPSKSRARKSYKYTVTHAVTAGGV